MDFVSITEWHKLDYQKENTAVSIGENCIIVKTLVIAFQWPNQRKVYVDWKGKVAWYLHLGITLHIAHSYYSCSRYVTANDYSNFQYLVIKFGTPRAKHYCCMCWHCHRKGHLHYKGQSLAKSQKLFNAANDVFAAIAVSSYRYVCAVHQNIIHSIHHPLAIFMHHYSQVTQKYK